MIFLAGKSPDTRCIYTVLANPIHAVNLGSVRTKYTVHIYGSNQPFIHATVQKLCVKSCSGPNQYSSLSVCICAYVHVHK